MGFVGLDGFSLKFRILRACLALLLAAGLSRNIIEKAADLFEDGS